MPLALSIVAARVVLHPADPLGGLASELDTSAHTLSALDVDDGGGSARRVFSWSYRELSGPAARMFRFLGLHPGPDISIQAAASLAGVPAPQAAQLLRDLSRLNMVIEHAPQRYSLHDLMRAYAAELLCAAESEDELCSARHRMFEYYTHAARAAALVVYPSARLDTPAAARQGVMTGEFGGYPEAMAWFQSEHKVLLSVIRYASASCFDTYAVELPAAMRDFLEFRGYWTDIVASQQIALLAAERQGDLARQARAHRGVAHACTLLDALEEAERHSREAIDLCQRLGDKGGEGRAHLGISCIRERQRRFWDGAGHVRLALELFRAAGDRAGEAAALINLGTQLAETGDYAAAAEPCHQGIALHRELGYPLGVAAGMDTLGRASCGLGQYGVAVACFREANELCAQAGARRNQAVVLSHLGDAWLGAGEAAEAATAWASALEIFDDLQDGEAPRVRAKLSGLTR